MEKKTTRRTIAITGRNKYSRQYAGEIRLDDFNTTHPQMYSHYEYTYEELRATKRHGINRPVGCVEE